MLGKNLPAALTVTEGRIAAWAEGAAFRPRAEEAGGDEETGLPEGRKGRVV
jgi:hypothetical protein